MTADPKAVDGREAPARLGKLGFADFKAMARDDSLTDHGKIGFPDAFRAGFGDAIWEDIQSKLPGLALDGARILDIGPGCGELPIRLIAQAEARRQSVVMFDHQEMLDRLPRSDAVAYRAGRFPDDFSGDEQFDAILIYSVLQVVIFDGNPFAFVDAAMERLAPGGQLLIGDIPNFSKLRRFLASAAGVEHHKAYMRTDEAPQLAPFAMPADRIDDGLILGLVTRARMAGFDAYLLPQPPTLPLANRREDLLIVRP
jgi:2-polyprenyl-3-methyl-5-hydroxy-6-metoxy-1,4-benzoquinol methylase